MSTPVEEPDFSRRERQIMDALYRLGRATASEIRDAIPSPPSKTAVRTLLTILVERGHVKYESDGVRYVYEPVVPREERAKGVIAGVMKTFFDGSVERLVTTLLDGEEQEVTAEQLDRLAAIIERARREGR